MSFWKKKPDQSEQDQTPTLSGSSSQGNAGPSQASAALRSSVPSNVGSSPLPPVTGSGFSPSSSGRPEDLLNERFGKTRSALGEGTVIQGKLSFDTPVRIDGKLSGEIFSSKVLIVGPSGRIDATIEAATLIVLGAVQGTITASERIELWAGASLTGVARTPVLVIQEGAQFSGSSEMLVAQVGAEMSRAQSRPGTDARPAESRMPEHKGPEPKGDIRKADERQPNSQKTGGSSAAPVAGSSSAIGQESPKKEARLH